MFGLSCVTFRVLTETSAWSKSRQLKEPYTPSLT